MSDEAALAATEREADLRQLGGLARARRAGNDHDRMLADGRGDGIGLLRHRQVLGIGDDGPAQRAGAPALDGSLDGGGEAVPLRRCRARAAGACQPAAEHDGVGAHGIGKLCFESVGDNGGHERIEMGARATAANPCRADAAAQRGIAAPPANVL